MAHNPLITGGGSQETRIHKLGGGTKKELSAVQISQITDEADQVYDQIWQLFVNYQMATFEAKAPS